MSDLTTEVLDDLYHGGETYCGLGQRLRNVAIAALKGGA